MPGWRALTQEYEERGDLRVAGLIQEQHPDRCRLFMQWHRMDWPVLVDSLNELGVSAVPITVFLDEYGVVRKVNPRPEDLIPFLEAEFEKPEDWESAAPSNSDSARSRPEEDNPDDGVWREYGTATLKWGGADRFTESIAALERALELNGGDGRNAFRLGVAYRKRFDSAHRRSSDFQKAIEFWALACGEDPNQYIWRRRIQQYGPRLDKPYSFYDWVSQARKDIVERGETPVKLDVEPSGAEYAYPSQDRSSSAGAPDSPDPEGRIHRDEKGYIQCQAVVVHSTDANQAVARAHLLFTPNAGLKAHWNNEAEAMLVWVDAPEGWEIDTPLHRIPNPPSAVDNEPRRVEFEIRRTSETSGPPVELKGYALYNVCEDVNGVCLYRRLDFSAAVARK